MFGWLPEPIPIYHDTKVSPFLFWTPTLPGFSHTLIETVGNFTAATYYDNVEVPADRLVGELHGGWKLITAQLNHERLGS
jgi:alkylation response protein AidB-like acyl-CoA dehydrogenase